MVYSIFLLVVPAFIPVDAPDKWWMSLVTSTIATIIVLIVTVFATFKYGA